jgi:serine/threonine protein kinase
MASRDDDAQADTVTPAALAATAVSTGDSHADTLLAGGGAAPAPAAVTERDRYRLGDTIGKGGMGEVVLAAIGRSERDVAIKRMRSAASRATEDEARFLREAKIQARLDHPAIVPVHELGTDDDGRPYFVMKRLAGTTLAERARRRRADAASACCARSSTSASAVEFAHAAASIHRDLKPANIMLGDYGEVYVLDWGVARVIGERGRGRRLASRSSDADPDRRRCSARPGYMAPGAGCAASRS